MGDPNHFKMLRPAISGIAGRGIETYVFTHRQLAADVERAGATWVDLYAGRPLEALDDESVPLPCRFVTFAGTFADEVAGEVKALGIDLVVYETFSVIAWVVARILGLPYVNLSVGHDVDPARFLPRLECDPRVDLSPRCWRAVEVLRERYGIRDASPFSYVSGLSPFLNLYPEPAAFLHEEERRAFEPIAFFGSLSAGDVEEVRSGLASSPFGDAGGATKLYISFGTIVWRYWKAQAFEVLRGISDAIAEMGSVRALIGLGGADLEGDAVAALRRTNVTVERWADQRRALAEANVFLTHQGTNSTHEAIFHRVPMISYPFFWDQPALARRCQELGLAIPLTETPLEPVSAQALRLALAAVDSRRQSLRERLAEARGWELEVLAERESALDRVLGLVRD